MTEMSIKHLIVTITRPRVVTAIFRFALMVVISLFAISSLRPLLQPPTAGYLMFRDEAIRSAVAAGMQTNLDSVNVNVTELVRATIQIRRTHSGALDPRVLQLPVATALRWDNVVLVSGAIVFALFLFSAFTKTAMQDFDLGVGNSSASFSDMAEVFTPTTPPQAGTTLNSDRSADSLLLGDVDRAVRLSNALYSRSTLLLVGGIVMSFVGIGVFWAALPSVPVTTTEPALLAYALQAIRPLAMLFFVEAIAWFLLRQYRALMEDYKVFHRVYLRRSDLLVAFRIATSREPGPAELSLAAALIADDVSGGIAKDQTTGAIEARSAGDANLVLDLVRAVVENGTKIIAGEAKKGG